MLGEATSGLALCATRETLGCSLMIHRCNAPSPLPHPLAPNPDRKYLHGIQPSYIGDLTSTSPGQPPGHVTKLSP